MSAKLADPVDDKRAQRRLRVLWLIKGLGPGGAEKLLCLAAEGRDRGAFEGEVAYLLPWKDTLVGDLRQTGVPVRCLRGGREFDLRWAWRLRRLLRDGSVDIVHMHSPYVAGITRLVVRSLRRRVRPKLVYTEHLPWPGYHPTTRLLNSLTFGMDDVQLAVSSAVRASIPPRMRGRVEVVEHGVPLDRVRTAASARDRTRMELGVSPDEILVGTVANLRHQKRYEDLLRAARLVIDSGEPVRFVAAGQGPLEGKIRRQHRDLRLGGAFRLIGYVAEPARLLAGCDLFLLASDYEGLPVAIMEALTVGLPVVAPGVPGIREAVRNGVDGFLVPPRRPDLLAEAVLRLIREPSRRREMSVAARESSERFDISVAVRRIEDIYRVVGLTSSARPVPKGERP